jgi:hypothetical protein
MLVITVVERPQRVLSRDQLLDLTRGRAANVLDRGIDTQVRNAGFWSANPQLLYRRGSASRASGDVH